MLQLEEILVVNLDLVCTDSLTSGKLLLLVFQDDLATIGCFNNNRLPVKFNSTTPTII
jgi:hypothetical protein